MSRLFRRLHVAAVITLATALLPTIAAGNSTPAWSMPGGNGLVAPTRTTEVRIERERLEFDFTSSLASPRVKASYDLVNTSGKEVSLDLLFIAPTGRAPSIALDGNPLAVDRAPIAQLPPEWTVPRGGIDPRTGEEYPMRDYEEGMGGVAAWAFHVSLPSKGRGTMTAEYESQTGYDRTRAEHVIRHLAYVLGPANNWAGFGTLEVSAMVPARYTLASSPSLRKSGESRSTASYAATFNGVPSELMLISTMAVPQPLSPWVGTIGFFFPFLPAIVLAIPVGMLMSRVRRWFLAFLVAGGVAYLVAMVAATGLTMLLMSWEPLASASEDLSDMAGNSYGQIFSALVLAPFAGSVVAAILAAVGSRRRRV